MSAPAATHHRRHEAGHLAFVTAIAVFCVWYLFDTIGASSNIQNLLLIVPLVALVVALWAAIAAPVAMRLLRSRAAAKSDSAAANGASADPASPAASPGKMPASPVRAVLVVLLLGLYVLSLEWIGFDLASFLFFAAALLVQGERRWPVLILLPLVFAGLTTYAFKGMLSLPLPTLLF